MWRRTDADHHSLVCHHQEWNTNSNDMFRLTLTTAALVACASAAIVAPPYHPAPPPHPPAAPYHEPAYKEEPRPYSFEYGVNDEYSGTNFNAQETADGKVVSGSYQVHLPDGRVQTVTYTADHYNGYVADVKYEGHAVYPKYEPKPYAPPHKPAPYHPAPAPYHPKPAPTYKPHPVLL